MIFLAIYSNFKIYLSNKDHKNIYNILQNKNNFCKITEKINKFKIKKIYNNTNKNQSIYKKILRN